MPSNCWVFHRQKKCDMPLKKTKNFEFRLSKEGVILFVTGMSFLIFLSFFFGFMVGMHIEAYPENVLNFIPKMVRSTFFAKQLPITKEEKVTPLPAPKTDASSGEKALPPQKQEPLPTTAEEEKREAHEPEDAKNYFIQAGSFQNRRLAFQLKKKLMDLGFQPKVVQKGKWSKVIIDGFSNNEEAKEAAQFINESLNGVDCLVRKIN